MTIKIEYDSTVNYLSNGKYKSMKTTIPKEIAKIMQLKPKDKIKWVATLSEDTLYVQVKKK